MFNLPHHSGVRRKEENVLLYLPDTYLIFWGSLELLHLPDTYLIFWGSLELQQM